MFRDMSRSFGSFLVLSWPRRGPRYIREIECNVRVEGSVEVVNGLNNVDDEAVLRVRVALNPEGNLNRPGFCDCCGYWVTASRAVGF